jgi:hypothetical protein
VHGELLADVPDSTIMLSCARMRAAGARRAGLPFSATSGGAVTTIWPRKAFWGNWRATWAAAGVATSTVAAATAASAQRYMG